MTDDEDIVRPGHTNVAALGTIRVVVRRIIVVERIPFRPGRGRVGNDPSALAEKTLHEKDKKLGGQSVRYAL